VTSTLLAAMRSMSSLSRPSGSHVRASAVPTEEHESGVELSGELAERHEHVADEVVSLDLSCVDSELGCDVPCLVRREHAAP
jgi:hypothetical protein